MVEILGKICVGILFLILAGLALTILGCAFIGPFYGVWEPFIALVFVAVLGGVTWCALDYLVNHA